VWAMVVTYPNPIPLHPACLPLPPRMHGRTKLCAFTTCLERYTHQSSQPSFLCCHAGRARPDERGVAGRLADGTLIVRERDMADALMTSIVLKSNVTLMDIVSTRMLGQFGFLAQARASAARQPPPVCACVGHGASVPPTCVQPAFKSPA